MSLQILRLFEEKAVFGVPLKPLSAAPDPSDGQEQHHFFFTSVNQGLLLTPIAAPGVGPRNPGAALEQLLDADPTSCAEGGRLAVGPLRFRASGAS